MARRRLRHKLMLGLALVAGSVGALVAGAGYGLYAYYTSVKTTSKKLDELEHTNKVIAALANFERVDSKEHYDAAPYQEIIKKCAARLAEFKAANEKTVAGGYDPDDGVMESGLTSTLSGQLTRLSTQVDEAARRPHTGEHSPSPLYQRYEVAKTYAEARDTAENLRIALIDDVQTMRQSSEATIRRSIIIVGVCFGWAVALVVVMLYYFRAWMFQPIRELQAGVQRVQSGNFGQPIALQSGDELQELADEFNAMVARLHAVYADLARQVNERSRQLVRSERMVSVGFLAAGVAHEINNPLASILFCSEALERRLQDVLSALAAATHAGAVPNGSGVEGEVLTRYLKMIQQEALRCKDITQKLLDFSRTSVRKKEPTDLTGLIKGVLEVARHLPSSRGKQVTFEPTSYIVAPVNAQDLKSVILNLVVNALDSMDDGGKLAISLTSVSGYAEMVFTDSGCGMSAEVLQNIFEPFFTKSRTGKGTGLGLFISHQIVDQHGGTITATSGGPGTGSTFTVRVPLVAADDGPADADDGPTLLAFPGGNREAA